MSQNKTVENSDSVADFIHKEADAARQSDCLQINELFEKASGFEAKMWGTSIIGYGSYHYKYESGREGDAPLVGFSPRKNAFALYISAFEDREKLLEHFGKFKTGKGCIYIKTLKDIDVKILQQLIKEGIKHLKTLYPQ